MCPIPKIPSLDESCTHPLYHSLFKMLVLFLACAWPLLRINLPWVSYEWSLPVSFILIPCVLFPCCVTHASCLLLGAANSLQALPPAEVSGEIWGQLLSCVPAGHGMCASWWLSTLWLQHTATRDHWHSVQSVIGWVSALWAKAKFKPGKEKSCICGVGYCCICHCTRKSCLVLLGDSGNQVPENASADNCKSILQIPPVHFADLQGKLEDKRVHCDNLWHVLGDTLVMAAGVLLPAMIMANPAVVPHAASPRAANRGSFKST